MGPPSDDGATFSDLQMTEQTELGGWRIGRVPAIDRIRQRCRGGKLHGRRTPLSECDAATGRRPTPGKAGGIVRRFVRDFEDSSLLLRAAHPVSGR